MTIRKGPYTHKLYRVGSYRARYQGCKFFTKQGLDRAEGPGLWCKGYLCLKQDRCFKHLALARGRDSMYYVKQDIRANGALSIGEGKKLGLGIVLSG